MSGRLFPWLQAAGDQESGGLDIGEIMTHQLTDSREVELPWGVWELPQWDPVQIGPLVIDLSPTKHVVFMFVAAILVALLLVSTARRAERARREGAGRGPRGITNMMEALILFLRDEVALPNIGKGGERYVPFVITIFFFILFTNMLGLVPWGSTATGNLAVTAALAIMSLVVIEVAGFISLGARGYLGTIFYAPKGMGTVGAALMMVIMTPVEFLGKLTKPFALAIRLFANMNAGGFIVLALVGLILMAMQASGAVMASFLGPLIMAIMVMVLQIFVAALQAYIFTMLTSVFIGLIRHAQ